MAKGKLVEIGDEDVVRLRSIQEAAKTFAAMSRWTGFSAPSLRDWLKADEYLVRWHESARDKIKQVAADLDPTVRAPVFQCSGISPLRQAMSLAAALYNQPGELDALRLVAKLVPSD